MRGESREFRCRVDPFSVALVTSQVLHDTIVLHTRSSGSAHTLGIDSIRVCTSIFILAILLDHIEYLEGRKAVAMLPVSSERRAELAAIRQTAAVPVDMPTLQSREWKHHFQSAEPGMEMLSPA